MAGRSGRLPWGSVRQERSGRWTARVPVPDATGRHRSLGTYDRKRDALDAITRERARVLGGTWVDPTHEHRLAPYVAEFIATRGYKPRTKALQERIHREWLASELPLLVPGQPLRVIDLGSRAMRSITPQDVRDWHTAVRSESRRRAVERATASALQPARVARAIREWATEEGLDVSVTGRIPATVRERWERAGGERLLRVDVPPTAGEAEPAQAYRLLHAALHQAAEDGLIAANPARIQGGGSYRAPDRRPATIAEVATIADAMPERYRAAVWVAALTSLRSGEQFALQRRDWDAQSRTLWIERALSIEDGSVAFGTVKSEASRRRVSVPELAAKHLEEHLAKYTGKARGALIFTTSTGGVVLPDRIGKVFEKARHQAGRDDLAWHDLRHTGQSLLAEAGASVRELQARAGHSTTSAALRYVHQYGDPTQRAAERLDALLAGERAGEPDAEP